MKQTICVVLVVLSILVPASAVTADVNKLVRLIPGDGKLEVRVGQRPLATYVYQDAQITRPFFAHVYTPGGVQVTRHHPPRDDDAQDHADMHPGIWMSFGDLSGNDYWRLKSKVVQEQLFLPSATREGHAEFIVRNRYLDRDSESTVCKEFCHFRFDVLPWGYLITWDSKIISTSGEFYFGDQEEMGLGVRLATPIAVDRKQGGTIRDSQGRTNGRQVWGKIASWCDYSGQVDGQSAGILIVPSPDNFRPCWWHARDYGFVAANPFGANAFTRQEKSKIVVKPQEEFRLRFGVLIHGAAVSTDADRRDAYEECLTYLRR